MEQFPSDKIDAAVLTLCRGFNVGAKQFADGVQLQDAFAFLPIMFDVQASVEQREELVQQLKDYSINERAATIEKAKAELAISSEKAEAVVGHAYDLIFAGVNLTLSLRSVAS